MLNRTAFSSQRMCHSVAVVEHLQYEDFYIFTKFNKIPHNKSQKNIFSFKWRRIKASFCNWISDTCFALKAATCDHFPATNSK